MRGAPSIRPAIAKDLDRIAEIELSGPIRWGRNSLRDSLDGPGTILVAELDKRVAGFIAGLVVADEMQIQNIAVDPPCRRRGVARALILALAEVAAETGAEYCFLEVGVNNLAAQALYRSLAFSNHGLRPKFYSDNEDAIVMRAVLPVLLRIRRNS